MIEVFRTNITEREQANQLMEQIHKTFPGYKANFDLDDCDRVLRVVTDNLQPLFFIDWLKNFGCEAEILPDN